MPRIKGLTEKQKTEYELDKRRKEIIWGLNAYKNTNNLTCEALGKEIGLSHNSAARLLRGEDVQVTPTQWLRIMSFAGLTVERAPL